MVLSLPGVFYFKHPDSTVPSLYEYTAITAYANGHIMFGVHQTPIFKPEVTPPSAFPALPQPPAAQSAGMTARNPGTGLLLPGGSCCNPSPASPSPSQARRLPFQLMRLQLPNVRPAPRTVAVADRCQTNWEATEYRAVLDRVLAATCQMQSTGKLRVEAANMQRKLGKSKTLDRDTYRRRRTGTIKYRGLVKYGKLWESYSQV